MFTLILINKNAAKIKKIIVYRHKIMKNEDEL